MKNLGDQNRRFTPCLSLHWNTAGTPFRGSTCPVPLTLLVEMALLTFSHAVVGLMPARLLCLLSNGKLAQRQWLSRHVRIPDAVE